MPRPSRPWLRALTGLFSRHRPQKPHRRGRQARLSLEALEAREVPAAGLLDGTFGVGGVAITPFAAGSATANSVAVQADGKVVAAGSVGGDFALARYNADGTLDA